MKTAVDDLKALVRATEKARHDHVVRWQTNIAFFKGYQYGDFSDTYGLSGQQFVPSWHKECTVNFLRPLVLALAAKLTQNRPSLTVLPASRDRDDRDKARLSQLYLDYSWEKLDLSDKYYRAAIWMILTGQGYWAVYWDKNLGEWYDEKDPETRKVLSTRKTGGLVIDAPSPFDIGLDPMHEDIADCEWGYRKRKVSKDWALKAFSKTAKKLKDDGHPTGEEGEAMTATAPFLDLRTSEGVDKDYVGVVEFFDVSKEKYTMFSWKDGTILDSSSWPYPVPYIQCRAIPNCGDIEPGGIGSQQCLGETVISDVIELQRELNHRESQLAEFVEFLAYPRILAHKSAMLDEMSLMDGPASVITWAGTGFPPTPISLGQIPGWFFNSLGLIRDNMKDISGMHDVSYGGFPGTSVPTGRALGIMAEQDAQKFSALARSLARMTRRAGILSLKMLRAFSSGPVVVRLLGKSSRLEVREFFADDIIDTDDVVVQEGSTFAGNKALRTEQLLMMWDKGLIQEKEKMYKLLEFADLEEVAGDLDIHRVKQKRELDEMLENGTSPEVKPWHNHPVHMDELSDFLNSTSYDELPLPRQQVVEEHYVAHEQAMAPTRMAEQQAAGQRGIASAQQPGMPPGGGLTEPGGQNMMDVDKLAELYASGGSLGGPFSQSPPQGPMGSQGG